MSVIDLPEIIDCILLQLPSEHRTSSFPLVSRKFRNAFNRWRLKEEMIVNLLNQIEATGSIISFATQLRKLPKDLWEEVVNRPIDGNTLLHKAVKTNNGKEVRILLELDANANPQDQFGDTALIEAACYGYTKI